MWDRVGVVAREWLASRYLSAQKSGIWNLLVVTVLSRYPGDETTMELLLSFPKTRRTEKHSLFWTRNMHRPSPF